MRPGKWFYLKAWFIYLTIKLRQWKAASGEEDNQTPGSSKKESAREVDGGATVATAAAVSTSNDKAGYGIKSTKDITAMEKTQPLSDHPLAIDAVLFSCGGQDGTYLVAAMARRKLDTNNTIFCLRIPSIGVLLHPKHPDTMFHSENEESWEAEGLKLDLIEPMKKWSISYEGPMVHQVNKTTHQVKLEATYESRFPFFDFDSDMEAWTVARAFAKEPWSREYFDGIRKAHQCHYEQLGDVEGHVSIDGARDFPLSLNVMRDHTHGSTRDWRLMHRYGIQNFTTKTGFRGFIGVVSQPSIFSSLELGYVCTQDGRCLPVQEVDLPLWKHGEGGKDPKDFGFRFKADNVWHNIQVKVLDTVEVFIGWQWEARILERFCEYVIDGVPGWGVSEWHYRHYGGRPEAHSEADPVGIRHLPKY